MTDTQSRIDHLRQRAEEALARGVASPAALERYDIEDIGALLHELQTYQAELEIQNLELQEAQQVSETATRRYRLLFGSLPVPALVIDGRGRIQETNDQARRTFGLDASSGWLQHSFLRLIDAEGEDNGRLLAALKSDTEVTPEKPLALSILQPEGPPIPMEVCLRPLPIGFHSDQHYLLICQDVSLRKEATALRIAKQEADGALARLREAEAVASMGHWTVELETGRVEWSEQTYRLFGLEPGAPVDFDLFRQYVHPEDSAALLAAWERARNECGIYVIEHRILVSGGVRWVRERADFSRVHHGLLVGTVLNITERRELEDRIRNQQRRLQSILDGTHVGTWEWNVQTGETVFNERWAEIIGYSLRELEPVTIHTWMRFAHPDDLPHSNELLQEHFAGVRPFYDWEIRMRHRSGHWIWVQDRGRVATWTEDGKPLLMSGTHQEITQRKRAEADILAAKEEVEQLRAIAAEGEQRLRTVLETVGEVIFQLDEKGLLTFLNPAWQRISGRQIEQCIGRSWTDFLSEESKTLAREALSSVLDNGQPSQRFEAGLKTLESLPRWMAIRLWPIHQGASSAGVTGTMSDITEIKQAERMKRELTSTVSHELRTPLTSIAGAIGLLNGGTAGPLPDAARHLVAVADKNAQRLRMLIDDLLDMEKLLAGKLLFEFRDVALGPLLEQAISEHEPFATTHGVRLMLSDMAEEVRVHVDPHRFHQVLSNLLSNAVKFSPAGRGVLVIARDLVHSVRVEVRDQGLGIDPEFFPLVFQRFAQADASDTRRLGGTGLGLAITRELVEQMHGQIGFESAAGSGATFWFELPVASAPAAREER